MTLEDRQQNDVTTTVCAHGRYVEDGEPCDDCDPRAHAVNGSAARYLSTRLADVEPEQVRWLWPDHLPLGKLCLLDGDPDVGKSTVCIDLAARVSTGRPMPGEQLATHPAAAVVLMAAEDGLADTIRPRLDAAGADTTRVHHLDRVARIVGEGEDQRTEMLPPTIPDDIAALEDLIVDTGAVLAIVDVLSAYMTGSADSFKDHDVRRALAPLGDLADRLKVCVILLRHLRKSRGTALYAGGGSIGIVGVARSAMLAATHPDDETGATKVLARTKGNLARPWPSLTYRLIDRPEHRCASIEWTGEIAETADDLLVANGPDDERSAVAQCADWLVDVLGDGPIAYRELEPIARAEGHSKTTLFRSREHLGDAIAVERDQNTRGRPSTWRLVSVQQGLEPNNRNETRSPPDQGKLPIAEGLGPNLHTETKPAGIVGF